MARHEVNVEVLGPWSLATSKAFWEVFAPATLPPTRDTEQLRSTFCVEGDWRRAEVAVTQQGSAARVVVTGDGDLDAAAAQACRFLSLDVDASGWPNVARRDPVIADAQEQLPGLRPCGFHSPTRPPPGRCCPNASVSSRRHGCATTSSVATATTARFRLRGCYSTSTLTCPAAKPSTCEPLPRPHSTGGSTAPRYGRSTRMRQCRLSKRSRDLDRSPQNS